MKKAFTILACSILATSLAQAVNYYGVTDLSKANLDAVTVYGPATFNQVKADSITVTGTAQFKNLEVSGNAEFIGPTTNSVNGKFGQLKVTGPFQANQVQTDQLTVTGPVKVKGLYVQKDSAIIGPLDAEQSHFGNLTINADIINLDNVVVTGDLLVKDDEGKKQTLNLKNSQVQGNINFESGKGVVVIKGSAEVKGQVKGAAVEKS